MRRLVLFGTPLALGLLELGHPLLDHVHTISMLGPIATWWIVLHVLLVPLFAMMGWAIFLLLHDVHNQAEILARYAAVVYIAFTIGYDTAVGLTSGIVVIDAMSLPVGQRAIVQQVLYALYSSSAITLSYYLLFGAGLVMICATIWALSRVGVPLLPLLVFAGTIFSVYSHALPFGPLGSACFLLAALWIELVWRPSAEKERSSSPGFTSS